MSAQKKWYKILDNPESIEEGKILKVQAGKKTLAVSKVNGEIGAVDNACPHMGGPLNEGTIENGFIKCPWHGYEFHTCTGKSPEGFDDKIQAYKLEIKDDGVYVEVEEETAHETTISDVMVETMVNWGVDTVFGMVGHSNLGLADAMRLQEEKGNLMKDGNVQRYGEFDVWKTELSNPNFSDFAQSCGMTGLRAENNVEVEAKMKELFQTEGPALLEVITDPDKM
jgi:nitrite reductase/ring-hydroxylating ferredoxin subunit